MKKTFVTFILFSLFTSIFAQQVNLVFTGKDSRNGTYVTLSHIVITDVTQGWVDTLYYPDTTAILTVGTGIEENDNVNSFGLAQNNPNPFNGTTNVNLTLAEAGAVMVEIADLNGRTIAGTAHTLSLQPGTHQFRVNVATTGIYFLTARQNGKTSSVKMVNNGDGTKNSIEYVSTIVAAQNFAPLQPKNDLRGTLHRPFALGDEMTYRGYSEKHGAEIEGLLVTQQQSESDSIALLLNYSRAYNPNDGTPCANTPTVTDVEQNVYTTVQIGDQCWMRENLRTIHYSDNTLIQQGDTADASEPFWYYPCNDSSKKAIYGLLYNWTAVMNGAAPSTANPSGVQGICPRGWHVSSLDEWNELNDYTSCQMQYCCNADTNKVAKAMADSTRWLSWSDECSVGNNISDNNGTGFSALPAGGFHTSYTNEGGSANFWLTDEFPRDDTYACQIGIMYFQSYIEAYGNKKRAALSVRCLRD